MALKTFRPTTPSLRQLVQVDRSQLWKGPPIKTLVEGKTKTGGRNNDGRITTRHQLQPIDIIGPRAEIIALPLRCQFKTVEHDIDCVVEQQRQLVPLTLLKLSRQRSFWGLRRAEFHSQHRR